MNKESPILNSTLKNTVQKPFAYIPLLRTIVLFIAKLREIKIVDCNWYRWVVSKEEKEMVIKRIDWSRYYD